MVASCTVQVVMSSMIKRFSENQREVTEGCSIFTADKGDDSQKLNESLYDE